MSYLHGRKGVKRRREGRRSVVEERKLAFPSVERILTRFPDHSKGEVGVTFTENPWRKYLPAAISWKRHGLACLPTELSAQHDRVP